MPRAVAMLVGVCGLAAAVVVALVGPVEWGVTLAGVTWGVYADQVSAVLLLFVGCLSWLVVTYARTNLHGQGRLRRFCATITVVVVALAVMVAGSNLVLTALGWTLSGLGIAALVAHPDTPGARRAAGYVRRRLLVGDAAIWIGVVTALVTLPSVDRDRLEPGSTLVTVIVAGLFVVAGVVRSSLVPFHRWLPETAEAPSPVSALLHAGLVNGAGILALLCWPLFAAATPALAVLVVLGAASVIVGTLTGRLRADVKGQLACSTSAQMGYMSLQIGLGLPAAALLHLIGHGCYKSWLFLRAGGAITRSRVNPAPPLRLPTPAAADAVRTPHWPWALGAGALAAAAGLPAVLLQASGATGWVPYALAVAASAAGGRAAGSQRSGRDRRGLVTLLAGLAGATYVWLLLGWEALLAPTLPPGVVWSAGFGWPMVGLLVAVGVATALVAARMYPTASGWAATALSSTGLPPWSSRIPGRLPRRTPREAVSGTATDQRSAVIDSLVRTAGRIIAPAWPLREMVAANPLAGLTMLPFEDAVTLVEGTHRAALHLPLRSYLDLFDTGRITGSDLAVALAGRDAGPDGSPNRTVESVESFRHRSVEEAAGGAKAAAPILPPRLCEAPNLDRFRRAGTAMTLAEVVDDHAAWWAQRAWARVGPDEPGPWQLWRAAAARPVYDRVIGVRGASAWAASIPADPSAAIDDLLAQVGLTPADAVGYTCAVLAANPGWAAHAQWRVRQYQTQAPLLELCALRIALDVLVTGSRAGSGPSPAPLQASPSPFTSLPASPVSPSRERVWQRAWEAAVHRQLLAQITERRARRVAPVPTARPTAQLVFCIDVRSERLRRALETAQGVQTYGLAGFFGAAVQFHNPAGAAFDQCPALIRPAVSVSAPRDPLDARHLTHRSVTTVTSTPLLPLLVAEAAGLLSGVASLASTLAPHRWRQTANRWTGRGDAWGPSLSLTQPAEDASPSESATIPARLSENEMVDIAVATLTTIGLVDDFAPLLVLCGHEAAVANNAFSSAYDCGACGGNSGRVNAEVLVAILNDPAVRRRLFDQGITVPADTVAVAAVHNTTTDLLDLDPRSKGWQTHRTALDALAHHARRATDQVVAERAPTLPVRRGHHQPSHAQLLSRSADWSEPMPEWGLAGNAAMVIGSRRLTADLDLGGRVFLHSYDPALDTEDHAVLEQILTAPVVVGQWINSQYYFSTVCPAVFGAGDKTTHNVVGDVGVLTGSHGDLRTGLPWQSLGPVDPAHHPLGAIHEPVRLLVVLAAAPTAVAAVLRRQPDVHTLLGNRWLRLVCLPPDQSTPVELQPDLSAVPLADLIPGAGATRNGHRLRVEQASISGSGRRGSGSKG